MFPASFVLITHFMYGKSNRTNFFVSHLLGLSPKNVESMPIGIKIIDLVLCNQ